MEGAAVGFVCSLFSTPLLLVKAVTNLRDAETDDMETFQTNLRRASTALMEANAKIVEELVKNKSNAITK